MWFVELNCLELSIILNPLFSYQFLDQISDDEGMSESESDENYIPDSETQDDDDDFDSDASIPITPRRLKVKPNAGTSQESDASIPVVSSSAKDEIAFSGNEDKGSGSESDDGGTAGRASECGTSESVDAASDSTITKQVHDFGDSGKDVESRRGTKKAWSKAEVAAVMRHFKCHIQKGHLATTKECSHCKLVEGPVLEQRTIQNVRDFVRNRGTAEKRQSQKL
ncbi:hypothetical protein EYF80_057542 [Liparis tanakae]|uniref:Uncharacterized protein n=1 Tax=Liparis tanakae TaxID=230148 RepID=A0A4Z2EU28_9TELE|nr:hypothetical protein EYF80_057542 [Liparis tanakae]